jgi:hypothetical protein
MIIYKGKYCPIMQYMPYKVVRFGLKVWAAADALSKYLWNFEVYCGKSGNPHNEDGNDFDTNSVPTCFGEDELPPTSKGEGRQAMEVVTNLLADLQGRGYIVTVDNFFTLVPLFTTLLQQGTMATRTLRENRKYIPKALIAKSHTKK